jgi:acetyl esterase/lipase
VEKENFHSWWRTSRVRCGSAAQSFARLFVATFAKGVPLGGAFKRIFAMLLWFLLVTALALAVLGALTIVPSPPWSAWKLAVLAGEYGHWFAGGALVLAVLAYGLRGDRWFLAGVVISVSGIAAMLLAKPAFQAWRMAATLPDKLRARFGEVRMSTAPFSFSKLFLGRDVPVGHVESLTVGDGLPIDFYRATRTADTRGAPCVVLVHGGGWNGGDRTQIPQLNRWLASRGYAVAAISYRLAPEFRWPAQRDDVLAALEFLKARASRLEIDPARLVLAGRSAGGQIAQTVAYTALDPAIRGVIGFYAPSDLYFGYVNTHENDMLKSPALMRQFLGGTPETARAQYESASAYNHVTARTPPTLLLHGENDALVWNRHSVRLAARLEEQGVPHVFVSLPWATHAFDYNLHGPGGQVTTFALEWFLASVTK